MWVMVGSGRVGKPPTDFCDTNLGWLEPHRRAQAPLLSEPIRINSFVILPFIKLWVGETRWRVSREVHFWQDEQGSGWQVSSLMKGQFKPAPGGIVETRPSFKELCVRVYFFNIVLKLWQLNII